MKTVVAFASCCAAFGACELEDRGEAIAATGVPAAHGQLQSWSFDEGDSASLPPGYRPVLGTWRVGSESSAPSGSHVLRQSGAASSGDYPRVIAQGVLFTDFSVKVRCRPEGGTFDRACGL